MINEVKVKCSTSRVYLNELKAGVEDVALDFFQTMNILVRRFNSIPTSQLDTELIRKVKGLILQGLHVEALHVYKSQLHLHADTSSAIIPSIIKACSLSQTHHALGLQLHSYSLKTGFDSDSVISNSIISFYAKFHDIKSAHKVFDEMPERDCISWNSMINCFTRNGHCLESLKMLKEMYEQGFVAKPELIASVLSVCVRHGCTKSGKMIHALTITDDRFENSVFLSTALVDLYWKSGDSNMAFHVFDSVEDKNEVSWTSMILGYVGIHDSNMALDCFRKMQFEGIKPNIVTLITILPSCMELHSIKSIHAYAFRHGFISDIRLSSSLIHLYSNHKDSLPLSELIFEKSTQKDVVLWTSMITGYSHHKESAKNSISLFNQMQKEGFHPNSITLLGILNSCTNIPSMTSGIGIHGYAIKTRLDSDSDLSIKNSLINMYSKCGSLNDAHKVFQEITTPDHVSWSALINAYGFHGYGEKALEIFKEMNEKGIQHDSITLLAVLSACNHSGLVKEGQKLFLKVKDDESLVNLEHYACYIDLLGRAGKVEMACEVLRTMPMKPSVKIMSSLVSNCKIHGRLEVAENLLSWFIELEPGDAANHVLLSMIYAEFGKWLNVEGVWRDMKLRGLKKSRGFSRLVN